jgi:hypothetical protein
LQDSEHFFLFFCGSDRAFAEPHAAEKAVFQHELMVERGADMACDQNGQQRREKRMAWNVGNIAKVSGKGSPLRWNTLRFRPAMIPVEYPLAIIKNTITYKL